MSEDYHIGPILGVSLYIPAGLPVTDTLGPLLIPPDPTMTFADQSLTLEWNEPDPYEFWRVLSILSGLPIPIAYIDPEDHHQTGDL